ncbi:hypothetical protein STIAU_6081 [Stigmatella aurantiaca DW4/3-1]|uniref:Uncharacterized protein n=1 Tax=Stigmatella aurantiaca (strain DW4/3-1) TaxID=378806 RepID=Q08QL9_STIAD|nr:hypothetical protein STIAU_6081 [Stigmatella aurantiaca DW4/3-1]
MFPGNLLSQPIIHHTIDDQIDPVCIASIVDLMDQIGIDVPQLTLFHGNALFLHKELNAITPLQRQVQPGFAMLHAQAKITVWLDF